MARGKLKTKRWNDPISGDDGTRILICRYRPRALPKEDETWAEWNKALAPSKELHADFYGKHGPPISYDEYHHRYLAEVAQQQHEIDLLASRIRSGETITLLCSSACTNPRKCHRSLVESLVNSALNRG